MANGRWLVMVLPFLLIVFLVRLASQFELFMSFLFPRLHSFFLILLSCHLSTLRSRHFVGPSASLFILCLNDLFSQMISCWWGLIRFVDQDLSLHLAFLCIIWSRRWGCDKLHVFLSSTSLWFSLILGWQDAAHWSCGLEFLHPWAVSSFHKVIGVHHVPCSIFDLNSSHDLPKLNWEFSAGVSPTKYP